MALWKGAITTLFVLQLAMAVREKLGYSPDEVGKLFIFVDRKSVV